MFKLIQDEQFDYGDFATHEEAVAFMNEALTDNGFDQLKAPHTISVLGEAWVSRDSRTIWNIIEIN